MSCLHICEIEGHWYFQFFLCYLCVCDAQVVLVVKNPPAKAGDIRDPGSIPGSGRSPGGGNGNQSRILAWRIPSEEPGSLQSTGAQSRTRLKRLSIHHYACLYLFSWGFHYAYMYILIDVLPVSEVLFSFILFFLFLRLDHLN